MAALERHFFFASLKSLKIFDSESGLIVERFEQGYHFSQFSFFFVVKVEIFEINEFTDDGMLRVVLGVAAKMILDLLEVSFDFVDDGGQILVRIVLAHHFLEHVVSIEG
jgi:hypothetical protein